MKYFETHAHLNFENYNVDRDRVLQDSFKAGVEKIINIGLNKETSLECLDLAKKYDNMWVAIGYHPSEANLLDMDFLKEYVSDPKVVAIGEIGLDFYRMYQPEKTQIEAFEKQLALAVELDMPVVIHDRNAHEKCFDVMKASGIKEAVYHCFSGDLAFSEKVLSQGWYISFTGSITYKNSKMDSVIANVPKEKFMIETDCPFLTPVPFRGKRNSPRYLRYIVEKIAEVKQVPPKLVADTSYNNAVRFFNL